MPVGRRPIGCIDTTAEVLRVPTRDLVVGAARGATVRWPLIAFWLFVSPEEPGTTRPPLVALLGSAALVVPLVMMRVAVDRGNHVGIAADGLTVTRWPRSPLVIPWDRVTGIGVATDRHGRLVVVDAGEHRVRLPAAPPGITDEQVDEQAARITDRWEQHRVVNRHPFPPRPSMARGPATTGSPPA